MAWRPSSCRVQLHQATLARRAKTALAGVVRPRNHRNPTPQEKPRRGGTGSTGRVSCVAPRGAIQFIGNHHRCLTTPAEAVPALRAEFTARLSRPSSCRVQLHQATLPRRGGTGSNERPFCTGPPGRLRRMPFSLGDMLSLLLETARSAVPHCVSKTPLPRGLFVQWQVTVGYLER